MLFQQLSTVAMAIDLLVSPAAAAPACTNTLFQVDGYGNGESGASFRGQRRVPGWTPVLFRYENGIVPVKDKYTLDETLAIAVPALEKMVVEQYQRCPNNKVALNGYSFGALVAGNVIESLASKDVIPHKKINAVLYGDPRRPPQNKGIEGPAGGCLTVLPNLPTITAPGPRNTGNIDVSYVCKENDWICNMANPFTNAQAVANEVAGYMVQGPASDHHYDMDPYGPDSHPGDHYIPQKPRIPYGTPLPLPLDTPNRMLNNNPLWNTLIQQGTPVVEAISKLGLPAVGDLFGPLFTFLKNNGIKV